MAGVDTVLRLVGGTLALLVIIFVGAVGVQLTDAIGAGVDGPPAGLNWPAISIFPKFMGIGLIGLILVVMIWWKTAPVRDDVRQDTRPPY